MSTHRVEIVKLDTIQPHNGADRLELAIIAGWQVVVGKGNFLPGDCAVYVPVDSVLPVDLELKLFPPDSKIKLKKSRIRSIKIRGQMSQGMLIKLDEVADKISAAVQVGDDVAETLGITKYEPPEPEFGGSKGTRGKQASKNQINPYFSKYTDIENIKWYNNLFQDGEQVYISEKLHGTSARYGYVPRFYSGFLGKFKMAAMSFLSRVGLAKEQQFVFGSRNCQLHTGSNKSWYKEDVYSKILFQEKIQEKLGMNECIYGEIVGHNIQKNYTYGCKEGEHKFYAYDVKVDGRWLNAEEFIEFCDKRGFDRVPCLYIGPYSKAVELSHRDGDSTIGGQKIREGVVIKPAVEEITVCGRKVLKSISDAYYLEENSDFH